ncbi:protein FANTASTIC FOUR 1-like [Vicia villosa]|uniref:protein FANTASTIC FOUR 1-like n=1 Tax=Vicia villosa TaxID=3911 RepID=UPI00273BD516|nr:protein FANTASTIC FOUR 1-like [Vicia villosa]
MTFHSFGSIIYPSNDYDYIGNESCIDLETENNFLSNIDHQSSLASSDEKKMKSSVRNCEKKREFPPPIPCLAQTQNLASHMPYVLKRYYTDEGRLIIKEEKVKHHEYFHAHRENGRLTLQLVPLGHDDDDDDDEDYFMEAEDQEEQEEEEINNVTMNQSVVMNDNLEEENTDNTQKNVAVDVVDDVDDEVVVDENEIVGGANSKGNYLNCNNSVISSPSGIFGVLPLRTVRG